METMREVADGLWVSGLGEAREWAGAVDLVIDCLDRYGPTGRTNHAGPRTTWIGSWKWCGGARATSSSTVGVGSPAPRRLLRR